MLSLAQLYRRVTIGNRTPDHPFTALIAPHMNALYAQAYHFVGNTADAEDLLQDVLLELYSKPVALATIKHLKAWLLRCLYHRFIDRYRKQQRTPEHDAVMVDAVVIDAEITALHEASHPAPLLVAADDPVQDYLHGQVLKGLQCLSPEQRAVISLHDIAGYTLVEVADMMTLPVGTLKSHLHRGRKALKHHLALDDHEIAS